MTTLTITHAGWDEDHEDFGLWAERWPDDGEQWFIPSTEATCLCLIREGLVKPIKKEQAE